MQFIGAAVKAIVRNDEGKYLVIKKSDIEDVGPNDFDTPGGRINFGEKPEEAVIREVKEETGLEVSIITIFNSWSFVRDPEFMLVGMDFLCKLTGGEEKVSDEHTGLQWLSASEIINGNYPGWLIKTIEKAERLQ